MGGTAPETKTIDVNGVALDVLQHGSGRPLLLLHPGHPAGPIAPEAPVLEALGWGGHVIAPTHPGFSRAAPAELTTIDDLSYLYLGLMELMGLRDCLVVGVSLGGWIALEMAVKTTERMAGLVLANAVGIKTGSRESRDIADIYAITDKELSERAYANPPRMTRDPKTLPESELVLMARSREATGRYAWTPYMHNPKLKQRLSRVRVPTLMLWGEADRIADIDYGRKFAAAIPGAQFATIAKAGHFPHLEQPEKFARRIFDFDAVVRGPR